MAQKNCISSVRRDLDEIFTGSLLAGGVDRADTLPFCAIFKIYFLNCLSKNSFDASKILDHDS